MNRTRKLQHEGQGYERPILGFEDVIMSVILDDYDTM